MQRSATPPRRQCAHDDDTEIDGEPAWLRAAGEASPAKAVAERRRASAANAIASPAAVPAEGEEEPMWLKSAAVILTDPASPSATASKGAAKSRPSSAKQTAATPPAVLSAATTRATNASPGAMPRGRAPPPSGASPLRALQAAATPSPLQRQRFLAAAVALAACVVAASAVGASASATALGPASSAAAGELAAARLAAAAAADGAPPTGRDNPVCTESAGQRLSCEWCGQCCEGLTRDGGGASQPALEHAQTEAALLRTRLAQSEAARQAAELALEQEGGWWGSCFVLSYWVLVAYAAAGLYASRTSISAFL